MQLTSLAPRPSPHRLRPPLAHARLHMVPPLLFPNDPLLPPSSSPPLPPPPPPPSHGALGTLPRRRVSPGAAQQSAPPPGSPTSPFPSPPPLPPHVSPHLPPATAPSARYLAVGNLWEQLSKARLHLAEAMALARHWGRTLVLPRVRTSRIGATWHAPRVFDPVLMGRFVPCVREEYLWRTVVPAWEGRGGASSGERGGGIPCIGTCQDFETAQSLARCNPSSSPPILSFSLGPSHDNPCFSPLVLPILLPCPSLPALVHPLVAWQASEAWRRGERQRALVGKEGSSTLSLCESTLSLCESTLSLCELMLSLCESTLSLCESTLSLCESTLSLCESTLSLCESTLSLCESTLSLCESTLSLCESTLSLCESTLSLCESTLSLCESTLSLCESTLSLCESTLSLCNLSQQRPALHPLHTFLSRASVKLLKTFVSSHELHPLPSSATSLTMARQQEKVVGLGGVLVQRCSALPPSKRARATRAAAADAYCSSHSVLLVRSPCSFSLSTVIANAAAASDAAVDERVWAQPFTAAVFEAPQHLPPFPPSPFAPSPWHALPLPQLASQRLQHLLHVLSSCAEAGKGRTAAEQHTRGLLLAVGAGLAAAGVVTAAAGCGAEASSAASMTTASSRHASAHMTSCSAALATRTHAANLSPPPASPRHHAQPSSAARQRVATGGERRGEEGKDAGRCGEVEREVGWSSHSPSTISSPSFPPLRFPFFPAPLSPSSAAPSTTTVPHPASNAAVTTSFACVITHTSFSLPSPLAVALAERALSHQSL
ncbi:unnamed protein product [Closterium sp. Naga37s-1]|nr:unnamed protein product [Closterium sp. Naga37s-1]